MRRLPLLVTATAAGFALAALLAPGARATEKIGAQEKVACTVCHDKPGSRLLTDKGKFYETARTLAGFEDLKANFGACTACHVARPGSKKLTRQGKQFQELVGDMKGLEAWMKEHHPAVPSTES
ncbi:MAG: hypothetical protein F9K18_03940 [Thermoanaerobaculia bacterium]|nr:MAG: hypothetical protein F9K18_03940 [Thermoanaerobaculia bacterium]